MSGTQTHGFDVVYGISLERFQRVLEDLFINDLPLRLSHVDIALPLPGSLSSVTQTGFFSLPDRPAATLTRTGANAFTLALSYTRSTLSLNPVPGSLGSLLGVAGLAGLAPTDAGATTLTLPLTINTATSGSHSPITIALASDPSLSQPANFTSLPIAVPAVGGVNLANMQAAVLTAVRTGIVGAVRSIFPIIKNVSLPTTGPCGIFPRNLSMKFLNADAAHTDSLSILVTLSGSRTGDLAGLNTSLLPTGNEGVLVIANALVRDIICCLLPNAPQIVGLAGIEPDRSDPNCCRWNNLPHISIGGTSFASAPHFEVCIVDGGISVSGTVRKEGFGWHADADFSFMVTLHQQGGTLFPVSADPEVDVTTHVEWWAYLVLALLVIAGIVIGALTGGAGSIAIGALIGALIGGVLVIALYGVAALAGSVIEGALGTLTGALGQLQLLPADLSGIFGTLDLVGDPVVDDMSVRGHVVLPNSHPVRAESDDQVMIEGQAIDLDRGIVQSLGSKFDPDFDLAWVSQPVVASSIVARSAPLVSGLSVDVGSNAFQFPADISARGSARTVRLVGRSFFGLTENDLIGLLYPVNHGGIVNSLIPHSDATNPANTVVFAVRTSEGRYAKCAAWQDSRGRLHLRYVTFDTPLPLHLTATWTSTRGDVLSSTPFFTTYKVARFGTLRAELRTLHAPAVYRWSWNGASISGTGTLPGTTAQFTAVGAVCSIRTQMGEPLAGELCVTGSDAALYEATACRQINLLGTERVSNLTTNFGELEQVASLNRPGPDPAPREVFTLPSSLAANAQATFDAQLTSALSAGMKVSEAKIKLR